MLSDTERNHKLWCGPAVSLGYPNWIICLLANICQKTWCSMNRVEGQEVANVWFHKSKYSRKKVDVLTTVLSITIHPTVIPKTAV